MDEVRARVTAKKAEIDRLKGPRADRLVNLDRSRDLELTYTSNAIEGNTLNAAETTLVIEQGITIAGKPLKDHLEAIDHHEAIAYVRDLATRPTPPTEFDIRTMHRLVVLRSNPSIAGSYADQYRYVLTDAGRHRFPAPIEIPGLMRDFGAWLSVTAATPAAAFGAHLRLVDIHPFNDGNGRSGRLLMNLILLRAGYPPIAVRPVDRPAYLDSLQQAQAGRGSEAFGGLLWTRLEAAVDESLDALRDPMPEADARGR